MSVPFICYEDLYGPVNTYISEHLYFLKNPQKTKTQDNVQRYTLLLLFSR